MRNNLRTISDDYEKLQLITSCVRLSIELSMISLVEWSYDTEHLHETVAD